MRIHKRLCAGHRDFPAISDFLFTLYQRENRDGNWFQPIWEYAYTHPYFDQDAANCIGIWEDEDTHDNKIVAVVMYESRRGEAFFQVAPGYEQLKPAMLDHAEKYLTGTMDTGLPYLKAYVADFDEDFTAEVESRNYRRSPQDDRPISQYVIPDPFPATHMPDGFRLKSLADENNLEKVHRVLWRGFNHPGEPPEDGIADREKMQSGPHYRKDLTIVVAAPDGSFVSFCGLWFDPVNRFGYVEPVATDPDFRRMGLGKAAVLEGIRRCGEFGATVAYVGSDMPFYQAIGFQKVYTAACWKREFLAL